jgi:hypothetical protein
MNRRLGWLILAGFAVALMAVFAFEQMAGEPAEPQVPGPVAVATSAATLPPPPAPRDIPQWTGGILTRPLFDPNRKEDPSSMVGLAAEVLPRLSGIVSVEGEKKAIFQPEGDGKPLVVGEGEDLAGWTVLSIAEDVVTIGRGNGTKALQPKFDPKLHLPQSGQGGQ